VASTAFPGSTLYYQRAATTQIHSWFVWAMGQPYYSQAAGCVLLKEDSGREGRGHKPMPKGRDTDKSEGQDWSGGPVLPPLS